MKRHENRKKKLIISHENLSDELRELFKEAYPDGYNDYKQKITKPDGTPIFVVPLETEDTSYMIKFEVRIDSHLAEEELEKEYFSDDLKDDDAKYEPSMDEDSEKNNEHKEFSLKHGSYEDNFDMKMDDEDEFGDDEDEFDDDEEDAEEFGDEEMGDGLLGEFDEEPNFDDIMDIEENFMKDGEMLQPIEVEETKTKKTKAKATKEPKTKTIKAKAEKPKKETAKAKTTAKAAKEPKAKATPTKTRAKKKE